MGGSRRRLKKTAPKVKVGIQKRKKCQKTRVPAELTEGRHSLQERLNVSASWQEEATLASNYHANKFAMDANEGFGRNRTAAGLLDKEARQEQGEETFSDDDEQRAACNLERKTGKAPPPRLTSHQRAIVARLVKAHGEDVEGMVRDTKLNPMLHSRSKLQQLLLAFAFWSGQPQERHDFRAPKKPFKRL